MRSSDLHKIVLRGYIQKCPIAFEIIFMAYIAKHKTEITQKDFVLLILWSWIITVLPHFTPMTLVQLKKSIIKLRCEILIIQRSKDHYNTHKVSDKNECIFLNILRLEKAPIYFPEIVPKMGIDCEHNTWRRLYSVYLALPKYSSGP